jgi:hypothetical protein
MKVLARSILKYGGKYMKPMFYPNTTKGSRKRTLIASMAILLAVGVVSAAVLSGILNYTVPVVKDEVLLNNTSHPDYIKEGSSGGSWVFAVSFTHIVQHLQLNIIVNWTGYSSGNDTSSYFSLTGGTTQGTFRIVDMGCGGTGMSIIATLRGIGDDNDYIWQTSDTTTLTATIAIGIGMPVGNYHFYFWIDGTAV